MLAVSTGTVDAARGGKGGGGGSNGGNTTAPTVTMSVSPNPVPAWGTVYTVSGTGFSPGSGVNFVLNGVATFTTADAYGYARSIWRSWYPGTYTAYAKQLMGRSYEQVGSITFTVQ
jgi:hypothetical protein